MSVTVEPYNPEWPSHFRQIKSELETHLKNTTYESIEHIGSTSVPGLAAKPIIDISIIVTRENVQPAITALETAGFTNLGERGITDRHALCDPNQSPPRNIYVCVAGAFQTRNHLGVRNTLLTNPAFRDEYGEFKLGLASRGIDIEEYVEAKSGIIQRILREAGLLDEGELEAVREANLKGGRVGEVKTERLVLKEYVLGDVEDYHRLESNPEIVRYQDYHPLSLKEAHKKVGDVIKDSFEKPRKLFELAVTHNGQFIGRVGGLIKESGRRGRDDVKDGVPRAHLWFSFLPEFHGKGFATEAMKKFIEVIGTRPLELEIECDPRNTGSWKMAERLGFERTSFQERAYESKGEWVDSLIYRKMV